MIKPFDTRFLKLLVAASSDQSFWFKNQEGAMVKKLIRDSALETLKRPPFISSAPMTKREWLKQEIDEFYQKNPKFKI